MDGQDKNAQVVTATWTEEELKWDVNTHKSVTRKN